MIKISKGLDLPITGAPEQRIYAGPKVRTVAVVGFDYVGMKPTMEVAVGDRVKTGQLLFTDKKTDGVRYTAPATGVVSAINRGERRVLQSVVIDVEDDEYIDFGAVSTADLASLGEERIRATLAESGLWCALRTRPYSKVPASVATAAAIFVNAMDTRPLAADPALVITQYREDFAHGLSVLAQLSPKLYVCKAPGADIPSVSAATVEEFSGPHPAGLPGTHIHYLEGASTSRSLWTINYQDVIAVGKLFTTGKLWTERVIALAGAQVEMPRLLKTRLGVHLDELLAGQITVDDNRVISGSVLGGRTARGPVAYLGRYHLQVAVLKEGTEREFMGWLSPGAQKHSALKIYLSQFSPKRLFNYTTNTNGSERAMVPMGSYEKVMPLDILPTQLLRALIVGDTQTAQALGCLELDEEDLALCTYVCPGKYEYGPVLRENLTRIEHEG
ncbi:MAG: Na+-transporting NADH:ubiquinone oxidoreductase subunit A [Bermanella sp.]|jgi:Na+-transporting NADH:ubiquinone oxidoreductase subunit A